jgi:hypothetical protein
VGTVVGVAGVVVGVGGLVVVVFGVEGGGKIVAGPLRAREGGGRVGVGLGLGGEGAIEASSMTVVIVLVERLFVCRLVRSKDIEAVKLREEGVGEGRGRLAFGFGELLAV